MFCLPDCDSPMDEIVVPAPVTGDDEANFYLGGDAGETYHTAGGNDLVFSGEGDDTIDGGADDDTITGDAGNDTITGGTGDDTFVFAAGDGSDTITDFTDGEDPIDLSAFSSISGFSDLTINQDGDDTVIDLGAHGGGEITLEDFTSTDLDATDFGFAM